MDQPSGQVAPIASPPSASLPPASGGSSGASAPDLTGEITTDTPPKLNQEVTYRVRVFVKPNYGATDDAALTFTLPAEVRIESYQLDHGPGCSVAGQVLVCDLSFLADGPGAHLVVEGFVEQSGDLTASAHIAAFGELTPLDNTIELTQTVIETEPAPISAGAPSGRAGYFERECGCTAWCASHRRHSETQPCVQVCTGARVHGFSGRSTVETVGPRWAERPPARCASNVPCWERGCAHSS